eukprot:7231393-Prymnesium_polylepis.1
MWRDHVAWRRQVGLYEIVDSPSGPAPRLCVEYRLDMLPLIKQAYPFVHHKVARCPRGAVRRV